MVAGTQRPAEIPWLRANRSATSETSETFLPTRVRAQSDLRVPEMRVAHHFTGCQVSEFSEVSGKRKRPAEDAIRPTNHPPIAPLLGSVRHKAGGALIRSQQKHGVCLIIRVLPEFRWRHTTHHWSSP